MVTNLGDPERKPARGKQQAFMVSTEDVGRPPPQPCVSQERKVVTFWLPRRYLANGGADVRAFVADVNRRILERGFVNYDGQIVRAPITDITVGAGMITPERESDFQACSWVGARTDLILERSRNDAFETPSRREWSREQQDFFGLLNPYQMNEERGGYTTSHLTTVIDEPYLGPGELIAALVHGSADDYFVNCECHQAEVVYTTRGRVMCMGCGGTHLVLRELLPVVPKRVLTAREWFEYFDSDGARRDDEVDLSLLDFRDVEHATTIWATDRWEATKHHFIFFARSTPEELEEALRGTEQDPSIFLEAGWERVELAPPTAEQIAENSIDVDLIENSGHAALEGVRCYLAARTNADRLVNAIPHLFRGVELALKAKIERLDPRGLSDNPNNPTVMKRLLAHGVSITDAERKVVDRLRGLRNKLQHGSAKFNYRTGLTVSRGAIVFLDRFVFQELDCWIGDLLAPDERVRVFAISELAATARTLVTARLQNVKGRASAEISECTTCGELAMVRKAPNTGAVCYYCGHPPPLPVELAVE